LSFRAALNYEANEAFSQAYRRAFVRRALGILRRNPPPSLLSFETVRHRLKITGQRFAGVHVIPLDAIVGTVGRYREFDRAFLPQEEHIRERWKRVYAVAQTSGVPPIDVYKIGEAYFVHDGHHRVSVLKEMGATVVEAFVTEFDSAVPLSPHAVEGDLDLKEEYARFLLESGLATVRPEQRIEFSLPGQYRTLLEHIAVHRYYLGLRQHRDVSQAEAVGSWYDEVYMPLVRIIRETKVLNQFPERTEADLYLWLIEHRHYLSEEYGYTVPYREAAADFVQGPGKRRLCDRVKSVFFARRPDAGERKRRSTSRAEH
jgi:hypothetical protein